MKNTKKKIEICRRVDENANNGGAYWAYELPKNKAAWRKDYAVKDSWNDNGYYVEHHKNERAQINTLARGLIMSPEQKEQALLRYFASEEYIRDFHKNYEEFWQNLKTAISVFEENLPDDYDTWPSKERTEIWHERVLMRHIANDRFEEEIKSHLEGDSVLLKGTADNYSGLISNIFNWMVMRWLDYIPDEIREMVFNVYDAKQASNIYRTLGERWRPGSILKETVTGPIDEAVLLQYLD